MRILSACESTARKQDKRLVTSASLKRTVFPGVYFDVADRRLLQITHDCLLSMLP